MAGRPLRVLHAYGGNLYGGIEAMLVALARGRDILPSMETHFALCFEGRLSGELAALHAPLYMLGEVRVSRPLTVRRARRRLTEALSRERFDWVVCHSPWAHAIFAAPVRAANTPLAFWCHGPVDGKHWTERWARLTPPDLAICNGGFTQSLLPALFPGVRTEVVYGPVIFPELSSLAARRAKVRSELRSPEKAVVIIQVSRMEGWKGQSVLLEALGLLREAPGWMCWIVGGAQRPEEARYLDELRASAARLGLADRVLFLGERRDVPELLAAADVFCQPNTADEAMPRSLTEAFFAELPVVATPVGGVPEIMDSSSGVLVAPGDALGLASALRRLLEDPVLRRRLGKAGADRARRQFDPAALLGRLASVLENGRSAGAAHSKPRQAQENRGQKT